MTLFRYDFPNDGSSVHTRVHLLKRIASLGVTLLLLMSPLLPSQAYAQAIEAVTLLSPWPPPGWPEGAQGEVRLVSGEDLSTDDLSTLISVLSFPIEDDGSVIYTLPERLPSNLPESVFTPATPTYFVICPGVAPTVSPPGVEFAALSFNLYADGEPWGKVEMFEEVQTGSLTVETRFILGILYASQPVAVTGSGTCANGLAVRYDIELGENPRLLLINITANATSSVFNFGTTDRFVLSQRPLMFGSE